MSVASSAMSEISVVFDGKVCTLEQALDDTMRQIQKNLNALHVSMRQLAALTEQEIDEEADFKESVQFEDDASDWISGMVRLLEEIPPMAAKIRGTAPAVCKEWYKAHVAERKVKLAADKEAHKKATAAAKEQLKALTSAPVAESKTA